MIVKIKQIIRRGRKALSSLNSNKEIRALLSSASVLSSEMFVGDGKNVDCIEDVIFAMSEAVQLIRMYRESESDHFELVDAVVQSIEKSQGEPVYSASFSRILTEAKRLRPATWDYDGEKLREAEDNAVINCIRVMSQMPSTQPHQIYELAKMISSRHLSDLEGNGVHSRFWPEIERALTERVSRDGGGSL